MPMDDFTLIIAGFPPALSGVKLRLLIEKQVGKGLVAVINRLDDGSILLKFNTERDLRAFRDANVTEVEFGNETHQLTVLNETRTSMLPQPQPLMSIPVPKPGRGGPGGPRQSVDLSQVDRPQTQPRRQRTVTRDLDHMAMYSDMHYWSSFSELPAKEGTMCVLAQNIDPSTHMANIKMHFESKKRSNGGLVSIIIRMIDGLLIIFQDPQDCESCLKMRDQKFLEKNLAIFGKKIPTYFERKFVVEGVGSSTAVDTLTMFLEGCSSNETSPISCKKQSLPGVYLIEYGDDFDFEEGATELLRNIQGQSLENKPIKGSRLLRTDCLKVTDVPTDVSSDTIRLKFESKKRTDGGPVTRVDRLKNKATLIYFAEFADTERVYERFKQPSVEALIIGEHRVEVELYFHSLTNDHKNTVEGPQTVKVKEHVHLLQKTRRQRTVTRDLDHIAMYTDMHYWSSFTELPAKEGTMCVLAQNIDPSTHMANIKMHFESEKRSNGGLVSIIIRMVDGLLIIFQYPEDCESCLKMRDQKFLEKNLAIFGKKIPTYFERKFVVEGVGSSTAVDTLTMFLEGCSSNETSPISCKKQSLPGVYLIEYGDDFDFEEGATELLRNIQGQSLENKPIKGSRLLRTDCLKVTDVPADVSSDTIRLKFESKKRTDGGPVTRVDRLENKATLIYFAEFADTERVYERFKEPSVEALIIGEHRVEVELYFHSLANDHKNTVEGPQTVKVKDADGATASVEPKCSLINYDLQAGSDENILLFLQNNQIHFEKLQNSFKDFASVQFSTGKKGNSRPSVKFAPDKKTTSETQKKFNAECKKRFEALLTDYSSVSPSFDQSKLQKARSAKLSPLVEQSYKGDGVNVIVNWKNSSVDVTGLKDVVTNFADQIKTCMDFTVTKMETNVDQYRLMVSCGIIQELQQKHPTVNIKCDERTQSVTLTGPNDHINTVQISALTMLTTIEKKRLTSLDDIILRYLAEMIKDSLDIKIQDKLKNDGVKAALSVDTDDVYIRVRGMADYKRAVDSLKQLIGVERIITDEASSVVVSTPLWKDFHQSLKGIGSFRVYVKTPEAIIVVGVRADIQPVLKKINDFLDDNATGRFCLRMAYGKARFIVEKSKQFSQDACRRSDIKCGLTAEEGGGVYVEGKRKALQKARPQMDEIVQAIAEKQQTFTEPGIKQYYQGEEGKDFLKMTERANHCIILSMSKTCPEWERAIRNNGKKEERGPTTPEKCYISVKLPSSQVSLQVWKTNIIEHNCDVIVNASNPQLQLLSGGVSGVIKELDSKNGDVIQNAMRELIQNNHGDFLSGDATITAAGNLKNCKRIVHAVGPRWNNPSEANPENTLKACIFKSLQETAKARMTSIAIPAISCGVFGGKINVCIPLIVEAVIKYFKEEKSTSIKRVDFVEYQKHDVLADFKRAIQKYQDPNDEPGYQPPPLPTPKSRLQPATYSAYSASANVKLTPGDIVKVQVSASANVKLTPGDIVKVQADVIVNITSPDGFPKMQGSSVSKALLSAGGIIIKQECAQTPGPHNLGSVFTTTGGALACRKIYHGIVWNYDNQNSKQIIKSIVSQCIKRADNAGYSSIAFPAIATGGYKHPPADVAKWMNEEISNFSPVNLKDVIIVLWPKDISIISIFQPEFSGASKSSTSSSGTNFGAIQSSGQQTGTFGSINVNVYQGDITQETSDAIVNSTSTNFDLSIGMVAKAIIAQGGPGIQAEVLRGNGTDYRITSGGKLSCRNIFHIVTPDNDKDISKKLQMVLEDADKRGIRSISFPALGTGNIGLTSSTVANAMRKAFEKFGKTRVNALKTINVVVFDRSMLSDFKKGILEKVKGTISGLFGLGSASNENVGDDTFDLFLYSTEVESINKALEATTRETKKMVHSQVIQDEAFERFSEWEVWELHEVTTSSNVKLSEISERYLKQFTVEGLTRNVMKALEAIKDILKEFCEAETTATFVTWQKKDRGSWKDYQPRAGNVLEKVFKARNGNNKDPKLNKIKVPEYWNRQLHQTIVDLTNLEGDHFGPNPPNVRRRVNEKGSDDVIPSFWAPMQNQPFLKVTLNPGSPEYQTAHSYFTKMGGSGNIIKIERIQNVSLYKQFIAKKAEVAKKIKSGNPVERQLFHGTGDDDKIVLHGFDRSYAGKNATVHGVGVYFALQASYSLSYATPNSQGHRRMFLVDVITGDYCQGQSSYKAAPPKPGGIANDVYDSVVNRTPPTVWVIFKDASAYPKFLITFT